MKTFTNICAQGDIYIRKIDALPEGATEVLPENGKIIVTHSETGHHHVMEASKVKMYQLPDSIMDCLLVVEQPTALEHLREHDTHDPILFEPGTYHVRRQREYTPEGFRRVED
ncbi:MAG: hypothetical protein GY943_30430 [Chloroflexi bacterium]|nr:hypothetical protein [Chloroflexota bacterium]